MTDPADTPADPEATEIPEEVGPSPEIDAEFLAEINRRDGHPHYGGAGPGLPHLHRSSCCGDELGGSRGPEPARFVLDGSAAYINSILDRLKGGAQGGGGLDPALLGTMMTGLANVGNSINGAMEHLLTGHSASTAPYPDVGALGSLDEGLIDRSPPPTQPLNISLNLQITQPKADDGTSERSVSFEMHGTDPNTGDERLVIAVEATLPLRPPIPIPEVDEDDEE